MKYARVFYHDELELLLDEAEKLILEDGEVNEEVRLRFLEFIHLLDAHLEKGMTSTYIKDARMLKEGEFCFPKTIRRGDQN